MYHAHLYSILSTLPPLYQTKIAQPLKGLEIAVCKETSIFGFDLQNYKLLSWENNKYICRVTSIYDKFNNQYDIF